MKKAKLLSILLAVTMIFALLPAFTLTARAGIGAALAGQGIAYSEAPACSIDGTIYDKLEDALTAVLSGETKTIKLLSSISCDKTIVIADKDITFDLNGYNLSIDTDDYAGLGVQNGTVALAGAGEFNIRCTGTYGVYADGSNVTVTNIEDAMIGVAVISSTVIVGGDINASGDIASCGVLAENSTITVNGNISAETIGPGNSIGVQATNSTVAVFGNISAAADTKDSYGVMAIHGAGGTTVTVEGTITVAAAQTANYIVINGAYKSEGAHEFTSVIKNYLEYTNGTSTVFVRDPIAPVFTAQNSVNLQSPTALVFEADTPAPLAELTLDSVYVNRISPLLLSGYSLRESDGISFDTEAGTITFAASMFGAHNSGNPLIAGTYRATISLFDGVDCYSYYADFILTDTPVGGGIWYPPPILTEKHIAYINGDPGGTVRPDIGITRAEAAEIFFRLIDDPNKDTPLEADFVDIFGGEWYYQAVAYLQKHGIIDGYPNGLFMPEMFITRAELVTMASRFIELAPVTSGHFPDIEAAFWAAGFINGAAAKGWIIGYPDGLFYPDYFMTRAQVVTFVNRMLNRKVEAEDIPANAVYYSDLEPAHWAYCDIMEASNAHEFTRKPNGYELWTIK